MLLRHRRLSIRPRRCSGRSNLGGFLYSCVSLMAFDAADFVLCGLAAARGCRTVTDCLRWNRRPTLLILVSHRSLALSFLVSWADS